MTGRTDERSNRGAQLLARFLEKRGLSQEQFASMMGGAVHQTTVSAWLRGVAPKLEHAVTMRQIARIPVEAWVEAPEGVARRTGTNG